ncbi:CRISPR system precrRNA processing endoribonuclease RAMP protein Cas6 [Thermodesulfovibrio sp. 3907-1M]|uniref:CRISPR system precrRNA processing endoribonuclease RAMP protein Cas6 n=1 Tax=Thermodesulfovibrio autotrophicus TaxID=3118333 RepID=A0AAU8GYT1_9BACT
MQINYKILEFTIKAETELKLPDFKGSAFRGGFGNVFRQITCVLKRYNCVECPLKGKCIYAYVFETVSDGASEFLNMHKYEKVPHPFIFEPPLSRKNTFQPEEELNFKVILIGDAIDYAPYFAFTFKELGYVGIGKGRGKFSISKILSTNVRNLILQPKEVSEKNYTKLCLHILTPIRIKYERKLIDKLDFHILIRSLLRRLTLLCYFHCGKQPPQIDVKSLIEKAEKVRILNENIRWYDWERYSSRQNTRMKLGGVIGEITYEGSLAPFIPFLKAGEILHIGKGTSFGLGKYEIVDI